MSAIDAIIPRRPVTVTLDLPFPPSVNRIWLRRKGQPGVYLSPEYRNWKRNADAHVMKSRGTRTAQGIAPFRVSIGIITVPFEATILLNVNAGQGDADNRIKCVLDYAQRIELIKNDKLCMKVTAEWVPASQAPYGCRLIIRELDRAPTR